MKSNFVTEILIIAVFGLLGTLAVNAQTNLKGRYIYRVKDGEISYSFKLKFEGKDAVYYSYEGDGDGTLKGKWSVKNGIVEVFLQNGDRQMMFKFKFVGDDLEVIETLHHSVVDAGAIFKKETIKPSEPDLNARRSWQTNFEAAHFRLRQKKSFRTANLR